MVADPVETLVLVRERMAEREELRASRTKGVGGFMPWPPCPYTVDDAWEQALHEALGAPWPCPAIDEFQALWGEVMADLEEHGFALGRGAFVGWGDGEPGLVRAMWCLTLHLRPMKVLETGVARGITTRFVLEALERNEAGHLWSIDLPPPWHRDLHWQIGAAVPASLRSRWTYVRGSSRRRLAGVLGEVERLDLFVHDSRHTERNLLFELEHVWEGLRPGGVLVADDVDLNCGFHAFTAARPSHPSLVCIAEPLSPDPGRQGDTGLFGLVRKVDR
jgi:hypothetical protein